MKQSQNIEEEHAGTHMHLYTKKKSKEKQIKNGKHNKTRKSYSKNNKNKDSY